MGLLEKINISLMTKTLHTYAGLGAALFLIVLLVTGVMLNHPGGMIPGAQAQRFSLAADPGRSGRFYRGTRSALERSDDGGKTWEEVPMLFPAEEVVAVAFDPRDANRLFVLQRWQGLLTSQDGGTVWDEVPLDFDPQVLGVELLDVTVTAEGDLFLETSAGLVRKPHGAQAWEPVDFDARKRSGMSLVRALHNGHFFSEWFVKVYDFAALALLIIIATGVVLWRIKSQ